MTGLKLIIGNKNYSSWSLRPWIAMKAKNIHFTEELIPFDFDSGNPAIKAVSASGKVSLLVDGDLKVWESLAIIEYLAERFPEAGLWPADRAARATARAISAEMASSFFALRGQCPFNLHRKPVPIQRDAALEADIARVDRIWSENLEKHGGPFLFGKAFLGADAMYAPIVGRFEAYGLTPSKTAEAYMDAVRALPAWQAWKTAALAEAWLVRASEV
jgi:glutathione S-transferase